MTDFQETCKNCQKKYDERENDPHRAFNGYCSKECQDIYRMKMGTKYVHENIDSIMGKCGVKKKFLDIETDKKDLLKQYLNSDKGIFIHGEVGTGKTVFVCDLMRQMLLIGEWDMTKVKEEAYPYRVDFHPFTFISSPILIMQFQETFGQGSEVSASTLMSRYTREDILIIDDLGAEKMTEFVKQSLYCLINEREQDMKRTIITSNCSPNELAERIDARVTSRIMGMCDVVRFQGPDQRLDKL